MLALLQMPGRPPLVATLPDDGRVTIQHVAGVGPVQFTRTSQVDAEGRVVFTLGRPSAPSDEAPESLWDGRDLMPLPEVACRLGQTAYDKGHHGHTPWEREPSTLSLLPWALSPVPFDRFRPDHQRTRYGKSGGSK